MNPKKPAAVLLLAFGGPDAPEAIEPFMIKLMGGRQPSPEMLAGVRQRYGMIGGRSPLREIVQAQAEALEEELKAHGGDVRVYAGMRYWHPLISETLAQMEAEGVRRVVALSLSPHYSRITTGAYQEEVSNFIAQRGRRLQVVFAQGLYDHPLFIEALAENAREALTGFSEPSWDDVAVIYSAHSLPLSYVQGGDAYVEQFNATVAALVARLGTRFWRLAYQSKGGGSGEWLGPQVQETLEEIATSGRRNVLLVPVGFAAEHVETLYDIDVAIRGHAESLGLNFRRAAALNTSATFIRALAEIVRRCTSTGPDAADAARRS